MTAANPAGQIGDCAKAIDRLRDIAVPFHRVEVLADVAAGHEAARIDRVKRGVRAVGGPRRVRHVTHKLGVRKLRTLRHEIGVHASIRADAVALTVAAIPAAGVITRSELLLEPRLLERIEVVPAADPDDRLPTVVQRLY